MDRSQKSDRMSPVDVPCASSAEQATFLLGRSLTSNVGVGPQSILSVLPEIGRHPDFDMHQEIAPSSALQPWDTPLADSIHGFGLGACGYLQALGIAFEQRNFDFRAEGRLGEPDGDPVMQVIANTLESVVRLHPDLNVYIPGRCTTLTGSTLLVEAQPRSRVDALGNLDGELTSAACRAFAVTVGARMIDQLTRP